MTTFPVYTRPSQADEDWLATEVQWTFDPPCHPTWLDRGFLSSAGFPIKRFSFRVSLWATLDLRTDDRQTVVDTINRLHRVCGTLFGPTSAVYQDPTWTCWLLTAEQVLVEEVVVNSANMFYQVLCKTAGPVHIEPVFACKI